MASHHVRKIYQDIPLDNPMRRNEKLYCDMLAKESKNKQTWTFIALSLIFVILVLVGFIGYAINLPKKVPIVITVLPWGEAQYVGDVSSYSYENMKIPETAYIYQVETFIQNLRSLPTDGEILTQNVKKLYHFITPSCETKMTQAIREDNPFGYVGSKKRVVMIESTIRVSGTTYQIDYTESTTGDISELKRYRALVTTTKQTPPKTSEKINPLGIYITDYNIAEISLVKGSSK